MHPAHLSAWRSRRAGLGPLGSRSSFAPEVPLVASVGSAIHVTTDASDVLREPPTGVSPGGDPVTIGWIPEAGRGKVPRDPLDPDQAGADRVAHQPGGLVHVELAHDAGAV